MDSHENKVKKYYTALCDCYEGIESGHKNHKLDKELIEEFSAVLEALRMIYKEKKEEKIEENEELMDFVDVLKRYAFFYFLKLNPKITEEELYRNPKTRGQLEKAYDRSVETIRSISEEEFENNFINNKDVELEARMLSMCIRYGFLD